MMREKITWPIGPARCVNDEQYGAYIVGEHGDFYVGVAFAQVNGVTFPAMWGRDGKNATGHRSIDLLPPKLTRDEAIAECCIFADKAVGHTFPVAHAHEIRRQREFLAHWEKLKAEGRVE